VNLDCTYGNVLDFVLTSIRLVLAWGTWAKYFLIKMKQERSPGREVQPCSVLINMHSVFDTVFKSERAEEDLSSFSSQFLFASISRFCLKLSVKNYYFFTG